MFPEKWKSADWHESEECYVVQEGDIFRIGNSLIERALSQEGGRLRTVAVTNKITGHTWSLNTNAEARATFAASSSRIEIPVWRYSPGTSHSVDPDEDAGFKQGFHRPDFADTDWQIIECFTSIGEKSDPVQPGYGWFRTTFELPADAQGQSIGIAVGGYDNEDWQYYRVFVNGEEAGARELSGRWREPTPFVLDPDHPGYKALKFGGKNILAVQAGRMNKLTPEMDPAETVRYFFRSRLVDQFVTVGVPDKRVERFPTQRVLAGNIRLSRRQIPPPRLRPATILSVTGLPAVTGTGCGACSGPKTRPQRPRSSTTFKSGPASL